MYISERKYFQSSWNVVQWNVNERFEKLTFFNKMLKTRKENKEKNNFLKCFCFTPS